MMDDDNSLFEKLEKGVSDWHDEPEPDKCFRKIAEELGELSEAMTYRDGGVCKVVKFQGKGKNPNVMVKKELMDIFNCVLRFAYIEGLTPYGILKMCADKMEERNKKWAKVKQNK